MKGKIANLHGAVAQAYADAGLVREAMTELEKAIHLCPTFADLRLRLANLYRQIGDLDGARSELEDAVEARPSYVPARVANGVVRLAQGDREAAIEQWQAALTFDPDNKAAQMYLRMAQSPMVNSSVPPESTNGKSQSDSAKELGKTPDESGKLTDP